MPEGVLVWHDCDFPYTHNISLLLELCGTNSNAFEGLGEAGRLTHYAITTRYPGEDVSVDKPEAIAALELAAEVLNVVRRLIH